MATPRLLAPACIDVKALPGCTDCSANMHKRASASRSIATLRMWAWYSVLQSAASWGEARITDSLGI
eukprot:1271812-Alexandrium_andersonii.AAC.1